MSHSVATPAGETKDVSSKKEEKDDPVMIDKMPSADEIRSILKQHAEKQASDKKVRHEEHIARMIDLSNAYREDGRNAVAEAVGEMLVAKLSCMRVKFDMNKLYTSKDGKLTVPGHWLHYGFQQKVKEGKGKGKKHWRHGRDLRPWTDFGLERPPHLLQTEIYEMGEPGFTVLDESDPSKSFEVVIRVYVNAPTRKPVALWHGLNKLPPSCGIVDAPIAGPRTPERRPVKTVPGAPKRERVRRGPPAGRPRIPLEGWPPRDD
ncbi:MAG: hypothetical protein Edafosvirus54_1 [Edafosvirus sp.]|uniref:Uncharacterized protein n=1 Tax=Edafosvirus sp. TaxID=2487765 RepID=A0A3G4ZVM6_9VIRU|nr:MAG: hypothetical protein Edafosvirus54_1 [Edafosvirus sp.]